MLLDISIAWSMIHILILFIFLYESRYSRRVTILATVICMGALIVINVAGIAAFGIAFMGKVFLLTCTVPSLIFFFIMAKERNGKFLFTFCLADTISAEILIVTNLLDYYLGGGLHILLFISRILAFPFLEYAVWRWLRKPYREVQDTVPKGWGLFSVMAAIFYLLLAVMSNWPAPILSRPAEIPSMILILLLMPLTYASIFGALHLQLMTYREQERRQVFEAQSAMMQRRAETVRQAEEKIRIERHDLRHRLQTISGLIEKGEADEALSYIGASQLHLDEAAPDRYCRNAVLDAILSACFEQARLAGIVVEARMAVPDELPVDASELSTVFANALENAIHACVLLPAGQRKIVCKCITSPRFMFEISNTCVGNVAFGDNGLPVAQAEGHGIGMRSISAFVEKHHAILSCRQEHGWFRLQIAL